MKKLSSKNPKTGKEYVIPCAEDKLNIDNFVNKHKTKKVVVVQGLGFVGTAMSLVCANSKKIDYAVLGLDLKTEDSYWKIASLNEGDLPFSSADELVSEYFLNCRKNNNFYATYDDYALSLADVIIVDVNLDVKKIKNQDGKLINHDVEMNGFVAAITSIACNCSEDALIIIETTVPPGTCKNVVYPILKEEFLKRKLDVSKLKVGHSYERVTPGVNYINSIKNFYRVYAGIDEESAIETENFLKSIISTKEYPLTRLASIEASEIAKVLENSYRAMNISFVIEWSRLAEKAGVDLYAVVDAIRMRPTHSNLMYPGIGVGGYCLTKDPLLADWASQNYYDLHEGLEYSVKSVAKNDQMPSYCFDYVKKILRNSEKNVRKIGLLGVAYGPGIDDTRYSPVFDLFTFLSQDKYEVFCHDPFVSYWEELSLSVENSLDKFLEIQFDLLIISTGHTNYLGSEALKCYFNTSKNKPFFIDTVGLLRKEDFASIENKDRFFTLGSGNNE